MTKATHVDEPVVVGADAREVRELLRCRVHRRATLCNRGAYPDFAARMAEASRVGAVIQAVMSQPFMRAVSWVPHTRGNWEVLHETGIRVGRTLAAKGLVRFASVDVVFFDNPDFDPSAMQERAPTPQVTGGTDTPVDPQQLMFRDLRSPSLDWNSSNGEGHGAQQWAVVVPEAGRSSTSWPCTLPCDASMFWCCCVQAIQPPSGDH